MTKIVLQQMLMAGMALNFHKQNAIYVQKKKKECGKKFYSQSWIFLLLVRRQFTNSSHNIYFWILKTSNIGKENYFKSNSHYKRTTR